MFVCFYTQAQINTNWFAVTCVKEQQIWFRWAFADPAAYKIAVQEGIYIKRIEWDKSGTPAIGDFVNAATLVNKLIPASANDSVWKKNAASNINLTFVYQWLYPVKSNQEKKNEAAEKMVYNYTLLSCDMYRACSEMACLFYADKTISNNKQYAYLIGVNNGEKHGLKPIVLKSDASELSQFKPVTSLAGLYRKRVINLQWKFVDHKKEYCAYIIERSADNISFERINKTPFLPVTSSYEKKKEICFYTDSVSQENINYYYRIRGINIFGETCRPSESIVVKTFSALSGTAVIDSISSADNKSIYLHWKLSDKNDEAKLKGFRVLHSEKIKEKMVNIAGQLIPAAVYSYEDTDPDRMNYYVVEAIGLGDDTIRSFAKQFILKDLTPPGIPNRLNGSIDKKGKVSLSWMKNRESDLKGYRVFCANSEREEMVELTKKIITDTNFTDQLFLKTLTTNIYYSVMAVDQMYNNSEMSKPLKLRRPDTIPPVKAMIMSAVSGLKGVELKWFNSTSTDLQESKLLRSENGIDFLEIKHWTSADTGSVYSDTSAIVGHSYFYKITCIDDVFNKCESKIIHLVFENGKKQRVKKFKAIANKQKNYIQLHWDLSGNDVWSYEIYKSKKGADLQIIKTVDKNVDTYIDTEVNPGNIYCYSIKVVYVNGAESAIEKNIEVPY